MEYTPIAISAALLGPDTFAVQAAVAFASLTAWQKTRPQLDTAAALVGVALFPLPSGSIVAFV